MTGGRSLARAVAVGRAVLVAALLLPTVARSQDEPALPEGLDGGPPRAEDERMDPGPAPLDLTGFIDLRSGHRTRHDPDESDFSLGEVRAQVEAERPWSRGAVRITFDLLADAVATDHDVNLETGEGWFDLREAFVTARAASFLDLKLGRQILTWGTGDLIFINDLFPKDFVSFFIGRNTEYLKAPSDSVKASVFTRLLNVDLVYTPRFDADRHIDGSRVSFFSPISGRVVGRDAVLRTAQPDRWFHDDEIAVRLHAHRGPLELAAYGYRGFWKSPAGVDPVRGRAIFPRLSVVGASIRGPLAGGITNVETGFYRSGDDTRGSNPTAPNSELRLLTGYERELGRELSIGVQYYLERLTDYADYRRTLPAGAPRRDEHRHVLTSRLTQRLLQQNLELGLFAYWSPSDGDAYLRPRVHYQVDDHWGVEVGGNVFLGGRDHTFFGQLDRNSNVYLGARYGF